MKPSVLDVVREQAEAGAFPWWDDAKVVTGAMRATGFRSKGGSILVIEAIEFVTAQTAVRRSTYGYRGNGESGRLGLEWLADDSQFEEVVDGDTTRVLATGVLMQPARERATAASVKNPQLELSIRGHKLRVEAQLPGVKLSTALLHRLSPSELALIRACQTAREVFFPPTKQVAQELRLTGAEALFVFDDWDHPTTEQLDPSTSADIVAMCDAVEAQRPLAKLPSTPNGSPTHWLKDRLALRNAVDLGWGGTWTGPSAQRARPAQEKRRAVKTRKVATRANGKAVATKKGKKK